MSSTVGVTGKLSVGDVIEVINVLMGSSFYEVYKIEGNKAFTRFRKFSYKYISCSTSHCC